MPTDPIKPPESDKKRRHASVLAPSPSSMQWYSSRRRRSGLMAMRLYAVALLQFELITLPTFPRLWLTAYRYLVVVLPLALAWSFAGFLLALRRPRFTVAATDPAAGFCSVRSSVAGHCDSSHGLPDALAADGL